MYNLTIGLTRDLLGDNVNIQRNCCHNKSVYFFLQIYIKCIDNLIII